MTIDSNTFMLCIASLSKNIGRIEGITKNFDNDESTVYFPNKDSENRYHEYITKCTDSCHQAIVMLCEKVNKDNSDILSPLVPKLYDLPAYPTCDKGTST